MAHTRGGGQPLSELRRGITAREFIRALHDDGFRLTRTRGSHRFFRHQDGRRVVVAYHRLNDTFPIGTLKAMIEDISWSELELRRLGLAR